MIVWPRADERRTMESLPLWSHAYFFSLRTLLQCRLVQQPMRRLPMINHSHKRGWRCTNVLQVSCA